MTQPRSREEIRRSLRETREGLSRDLERLEDKIEHGLDPRRLLARHPWIVGAAGALVGLVLLRRPAAVVRLASRALTWGAPLVVSTLFRQLSTGPSGDGRQAPVPPPRSDA